MKLSVASGKGGTGKTLVTVSLFDSLKGRVDTVLADIDVECPDAALFLKSKKEESTSAISAVLPQIDLSKCSLCGVCVDKCTHKAIARTGSVLLHMPELCKSCMRCLYNCKNGAIGVKTETIGTITRYRADGNSVIEGKLKTGDVRTAYCIREVKKYTEKENSALVIYDCPPGTSCPMVNAVMGTDYCLVIAEDSPFGYSDFLLTLEVLDELHLPYSVIINKYRGPDGAIEHHCADKKIRILATIPYSKKIHTVYSSAGNLLSLDEVASAIATIADFIEKELLCTK